MKMKSDAKILGENIRSVRKKQNNAGNAGI